MQWHDEIEDALGEDSKETRERLAGLNSRRDAMNEVRVYLKEAWEMMGPSFLETVAATEKKNDDGACMEDVAMHYENQEPLEESVDVNQEVGGSDLTPQRDKGGFFILFIYNREG